MWQEGAMPILKKDTIGSLGRFKLRWLSGIGKAEDL
jgi:hypothetical protein